MENKLRGNDFWGEGIPDYEKEDLMSKREILDFSIDIYFCILSKVLSNQYALLLGRE